MTADPRAAARPRATADPLVATRTSDLEGRPSVLTVDFTRFPLAAGDRVLDLGCGAGLHAFECYRRGAQVVVFDQNGEEIREVAKWFAAMKEALARPRRRPSPPRWRATPSTCPSPTTPSTSSSSPR
ncbi:hypothetical protein SVIOM342S_02032 [Streptomyces violaceorubidus]